MPAQKGSKRQPSYKDEPGHFYVAQLHHYGLPVVKSKAAAKKKLLAAYGNGRSLKVPRQIQDLERELWQRIADARRVAKEQEDRNPGKQVAPIQRKAVARQLDAFDDASKVGTGNVHNAIESLTKEQLRQIVSGLVNTVPALHRAIMETAGLDTSKEIKNIGKVSSQFLSCPT